MRLWDRKEGSAGTRVGMMGHSLHRCEPPPAVVVRTQGVARLPVHACSLIPQHPTILVQIICCHLQAVPDTPWTRERVSSMAGCSSSDCVQVVVRVRPPTQQELSNRECQLRLDQGGA